MPKPDLRGSVHRWMRIGALSLFGCSVFSACADEPILTDQVVPVQFRRTKPDEAEDAFQYEGLTVVRPGTSSTAWKKSALAQLPLNRLGQADREQAAAVVKGTSLYRRLPTISFEVDSAVYGYFLKNPDVAVASWRAMGISKFLLEPGKSSTFTADAGDGSRGLVRVYYTTPEDTLIFCEGAFKSPLLPKPIIAKSLMRLESKFEKQNDGRMIATHHGDVFVEFPSQTVETVARLISPVSYSIADRNFKQLTFYAHMMSVAMARQPGWVEAIGRRLEGISEERREEFLRLSAATYIAARQREAASSTQATSTQAISLEEVLRPLQGTPTILPASASNRRSAAPSVRIPGPMPATSSPK